MYLQAPSVFGLQQFGDGKQDRIHGYSLLEFACCDDHVALRLLPRKILKMTDGSQRAVPDFEQTLDDDNSITFELRSTNFRVVQKKSEMSLAAPQLSILSASAESSDILNAIRQTLLLSESHSKVRQVELSKSTSFKANGRVFWLIADWGMGSDEFIASVLKYEITNSFSIYRIDLQSLMDISKLDDWLRNLLGINYQTLCVELVKRGPSCLILDLADVEHIAKGGGSFTADVERLGKIALDFCPELVIVLRSRKRPITPQFGLVELTVLSEADLKLYVENHVLGGQRLANSENVRRLFRFTEGVP